MKKKILGVGAGVFTALFIMSGSKILCWHIDACRSQKEFEETARLICEKEISAEKEAGAEKESDEPELLEAYRTVYGCNPDFAGWITIEGTNIDYPVMQSKDEPDFYLTHNFNKEYSAYGVPYIQADCDLTASDNLIIYGHHMKNGSMFSELCKYEDEEFYASHSRIGFNTRYGYGEYEIAAVFRTSASEDGFPYYQFVKAENEEEFLEYLAACRELSLYETGTEVQYGDRLITLSTCDYSLKDGRMVIVARLINETDDAD